MTAITNFIVRAVDNVTREAITSCVIGHGEDAHDAAFDWVEDRAADVAARTGAVYDIETSVHDADGNVVDWQRAGIRVGPCV